MHRYDSIEWLPKEYRAASEMLLLGTDIAELDEEFLA